jgi:hypothetical protein
MGIQTTATARSNFERAGFECYSHFGGYKSPDATCFRHTSFLLSSLETRSSVGKEPQIIYCKMQANAGLSVVPFQNINAEEMYISDKVNKGTYGISRISLVRPGQFSLLIQTPLFDRVLVKQWDSDYNVNGTLNVAFGMKGSDDASINDAGARRDGVYDFVRTFLGPLEDRVKRLAAANSVEWFGKVMSITELDANFKSHIRPGNMPGRDGFFVANISRKEKAAQCTFFLENKNLISLEQAIALTEKGVHKGRAILELSCIYITKTRSYSLAMNVVQLMLMDETSKVDRNTLTSDFAFVL